MPATPLASASRRTALLGVAALCLSMLWFALLGGRPLYDPDEGRYAQIPREMLGGGDWVTPHLNGLVYLEKPPLQYWLTALSFRYLGQSEFAARLCTGLAGYLSLALVFYTGYRLWGLDAGLKALLLTGASALFVLLGHQLTLDMLLALWLLASLVCFLLAQLQADQLQADHTARCRAWMLGCWASMALGVLTKGLIGALIPAATLALYAVWQRDGAVLRRLHVRWGLPLFAILTAPWWVLAARANPEFLQFFFIHEHFQRFLTPISQRTEPWWFFVAVLMVGVLAWLPQALHAFASGWRASAGRGRFDAVRVLWIWCVFILVFFSLSDSKLIPYILPIVPALALLCARPAGESRGHVAGGALLSLAASGGILLYVSGIWGSAAARALATQLRPYLIYTAALLALAAVLCLLLLARKRVQRALAILCGGWSLACASVLVAANAAQQNFSARDLALALRALVPVTAPVYAVQVYDQSLPFYMQRTVTLVDYQDEFALGLRRDPARGIATLSDFAKRWRESDAGYAIMRPPTRGALAAMGLPMREILHVQNRIVVSRR